MNKVIKTDSLKNHDLLHNVFTHYILTYTNYKKLIMTKQKTIVVPITVNVNKMNYGIKDYFI